MIIQSVHLFQCIVFHVSFHVVFHLHALIMWSRLQPTSIGSDDSRSRPLLSHEAEDTSSAVIVLNKDAAPVGAAGVGFRGRAVDRFRKPATVIFSDELVTDTTSTLMVSLPHVRAN